MVGRGPPPLQCWPSVELAAKVAMDLFVDDVNGSCREPELPMILQWLLQTFASLLGKAKS